MYIDHLRDEIRLMNSVHIIIQLEDLSNQLMKIVHFSQRVVISGITSLKIFQMLKHRKIHTLTILEFEICKRMILFVIDVKR